jgi:hypothetical protein
MIRSPRIGSSREPNIGRPLGSGSAFWFKEEPLFPGEHRGERGLPSSRQSG